MKYLYKWKSWVMGQNKTVTSVTSVTTRPFCHPWNDSMECK